jgi:hypothetical protein
MIIILFCKRSTSDYVALWDTALQHIKRDNQFVLGQRPSITGLASTSIDNAKELGAGLGIGFKAPPDGTGGGTGRCFLYSPHDHTKVPTFHHNGHTQWLDRVDNGVTDLSGQTFLNLEAARVNFGNASEFRQTNHRPIGDIPNMDHATKGNHMVFTVFAEAGSVWQGEFGDASMPPIRTGIITIKTT